MLKLASNVLNGKDGSILRSFFIRPWNKHPPESVQPNQIAGAYLGSTIQVSIHFDDIWEHFGETQ